MILEFSGLKFNVEFFNTTDNDKPCLLFLHGFTGSSLDWNNIAVRIDRNFSSAGIDLIGHGESSSPEKNGFYSAEEISNQIKKIVELVIKRKVIPVGYSMGGRAALSFAIKNPEMIEALILESTTPGIEEENLRQERIKKDEEIADFIESNSLDKFSDFWMNLELFNTQRRFSEEKRKQFKLARMKNNPTGLANSLRKFGTGVMPPLFSQLKNIKCRTLLITGELDSKFTGINSKIAGLFPNAEHKIIKSAGHNTHLEEPARFIEVVNNFLET